MIVPPNGAGGGGICRPSMVVVALGAPGVPVICWAAAGMMPTRAKAVDVRIEHKELGYLTRETGICHLVDEVAPFRPGGNYISQRLDRLIISRAAYKNVKWQTECVELLAIPTVITFGKLTGDNRMLSSKCWTATISTRCTCTGTASS